MRDRIVTSLIAVAALAVAALPAAAHHGWSGYDNAKEMTLTGVIRQSGYEHPHGHVQLETQSKTWRIVLAPPTRMQARGLPASALAAGKTATVVGYPHKSDAEELRAERITVDGKTVELR